MRVLGIMSGTSVDAVDYTICQFGPDGAIRFLEHWQTRFPRALRRRLLAAAGNEAPAHELGQLHHDLGRCYAAGAAGAKVDLVGLHGQTVYHRPHRAAPATLQIGEPAWLAQALRRPVVSNFRAGDLAAGGQGAPLATMFHRRVFAERGCHAAVQNLGGIANVTSLDWTGRGQPRIAAFDTGPANLPIDLAARELTGGRHAFDRDGGLARGGRIDARALGRWLRHPYLRKAPPKSTGREQFGAAFFDRCRGEVARENLAATLTEFTARSIALNYKWHLPSVPRRVILCGGGAENPFLAERIAVAVRALRADAEIVNSRELGWAPQTIEGAAFALLAWLRWHEQPGNIPATTGASRPCLLGQITLP